jgi:Protein of unknown function (DUF3823) N-terminal domain/Domain of unknown function (DUF3823_C)
MNKIKYIALCVASIIGLGSCQLDEMQAPEAGLYGSIIDVATGKLVEQDIIRGGGLEIREFGYKNVSPQFLNYKVDGTYADTKLFANKYKAFPILTNFTPIDTLVVDINGQTKLDLVVSPYIRILNPSITKTGTLITATFSLEQTGFGSVSKIGLYAGADKNLGEPMRLTRVEKTIDAPVAPLSPSVVYTLTLDTATEIDLKAGKLYFFRIGALYSAPNARFNYATAVPIQL